MTTHELANVLDHLKLGLGSFLKSDAGKGLDEAAAAIRELPDQPLKELAEQLRNQNGSTPSHKAGKASVDVSAIIEQIRAVQAGIEPAEAVSAQLSSLNNSQLKQLLTAFGRKPTTKVADNLARVRQLLDSQPQESGAAPVEPSTVVDQEQIEQGVRIYTQLRDDRQLSIPDVRAGFEPLRAYSKPVLEAISRRVGHTPYGSREDTLKRMLSNLEGLKMSQMRVDMILTGA